MGRRQTVDTATILAEARAVFLEQGAFGSTKEIARRAGLSEAALFKRFPTKAKLFLAALLPETADPRAEIAWDEPDTRKALIETGHRIHAYLRRVIPMALHLMANPAISMADVTEHFGARQLAGSAPPLAEFLKQRHDAGLLYVPDPRTAAFFFASAVHSLALYEVMEFHGGHPMDHAIAPFVDVFLAGIGPRPTQGKKP